MRLWYCAGWIMKYCKNGVLQLVNWLNCFSGINIHHWDILSELAVNFLETFMVSDHEVLACLGVSGTRLRLHLHVIDTSKVGSIAQKNHKCNHWCSIWSFYLHYMKSFYIHKYVLQSGRWLHKCKRLVVKLFLVFLRHKSLAAVATVLDLWLVQVDVDPGVPQGCPSVTVGVATGNDYHWLLCNQVDGKLLVYLSDEYIHVITTSYTAAIIHHMWTSATSKCIRPWVYVPAYVCRWTWHFCSLLSPSTEGNKEYLLR